MLGIEFAMLIIDLSVSNLPLFSFVAFMWASPLGIDSPLIRLPVEISWCVPLDAFNAIGNLVGSPPLMVNETTLTLEHVMKRLDAIEKKIITGEYIENLDKKMHNFATKIGSKVGEVFKLLKEKGTIIHERIEESSSQIHKLEKIFSNLSMAFASAKTIEKTPVKVGKTTQVTKNKCATSSNIKEDLKMISIHLDIVEVIRDPFAKNEFF